MLLQSQHAQEAAAGTARVANQSTSPSAFRCVHIAGRGLLGKTSGPTLPLLGVAVCLLLLSVPLSPGGHPLCLPTVWCSLQAAVHSIRAPSKTDQWLVGHPVPAAKLTPGRLVEQRITNVVQEKHVPRKLY